jgi:DNA-binding NtrC family response regulator
MQTNRTRPGVTRLGALRVVDPAAWRSEIARALAAADGRVSVAAEVLGVAPRTLRGHIRDMRAA